MNEKFQVTTVWSWNKVHIGKCTPFLQDDGFAAYLPRTAAQKKHSRNAMAGLKISHYYYYPLKKRAYCTWIMTQRVCLNILSFCNWWLKMYYWILYLQRVAVNYCLKKHHSVWSKRWNNIATTRTSHFEGQPIQTITTVRMSLTTLRTNAQC